MKIRKALLSRVWLWLTYQRPASFGGSAFEYRPIKSRSALGTLPRRNCRGASLVAVSLFMFIFVGAITLFTQGLVRKERSHRADEVVNFLAQISGDLDFWIHDNSPALLEVFAADADGTAADGTLPSDTTMTGGTLTGDATMTSGAEPPNSVLNLTPDQITDLRRADTSFRYGVTAVPHWTMTLMAARIAGEPLPFGVIVARPTTLQAQSLAHLVNAKLAERIGSSQLGGGDKTALDVRDMLNRASRACKQMPCRPVASSTPLGNADVALFTYQLNGLDKSYVRRQAFAGYPHPTLDTDLSLGGHDITHVAELRVKTGAFEAATAAEFKVTNDESGFNRASVIDSLIVQGDAGFRQDLTSASIVSDQLAGKADILANDLDIKSVIRPSKIRNIDAEEMRVAGDMFLDARLASQAFETLDVEAYFLKALTISTTFNVTQTGTDNLAAEAVETQTLSISEELRCLAC